MPTYHDNLVLVRVVEPIHAVVAVLHGVESDEFARGSSALRGYRVDDDARLEVDDEILVRVHFAGSPRELPVEASFEGLAGRGKARGREASVAEHAILGAQRYRLHTLERALYSVVAIGDVVH